MKRTFGRCFIADDGDAKYPLELLTPTRARRRWRSRWYADQGATPHCVGYAAARWLECDPLCQFLDPDGIYDIALNYDEWEGNEDEGTSVRAAFKVLKLVGHAPQYHWATSIDQVVGWILERGPMVLGVNWYRGMSAPDEEGVIVPRGPLDGGHAILADGVDVPRELIWLNNSWGPDWGLDGRAAIHFDHVARLLREDGEACCGVEAIPRYR